MKINFFVLFSFLFGIAKLFQVQEHKGKTFMLQYKECKDMKREIIVNSTEKDLGSSRTITDVPCLTCEKGFYTFYDLETDTQSCIQCPIGTTNSQGNLLINRWDKEKLKEYVSENSCEGEQCKQWVFNEVNIHSTQISKANSSFTLAQSSVENGKITFEYMITGNCTFSLFINDKEVYVDNTTKNMRVTGSYDIAKGKNSFKFKHNSTSNSSVYISYILIEKVDYSAFECDQYKPLSSLELSKCDHNLVCEENDICTKKFYYKNFSPFCYSGTNTQSVDYSLIMGARCNELDPPKPETISCKPCEKGQFRKELDDEKYTCSYCPSGEYRNNSGSEWCEKCDKNSDKIFYYYPKLPNKAFLSFSIRKVIGYLTIKYKKFDEEKPLELYVQIDDVTRVFDSVGKINNLEMEKGLHFLNMTGSNTEIEEIVIQNSNLGGGYNCYDEKKEEVVSPKQEKEEPKERDDKNPQKEKHKKCYKNQLYFSSVSNSCEKCPSLSKLEMEDSETYCSMKNNFIIPKYMANFQFSNLLASLKNKNLLINFEKENFSLKLKGNSYITDLKKNITIGKELKEIKILMGEFHRGILMQYVSDKKCKDSSYLRVYILFECNLNLVLYTTSMVKYNEDKCSYYIRINTPFACPVCRTDDVKEETTGCSKNNREIHMYSEKKNCSILSFEPEKNTLSDLEQDNIMLNVESKNLLAEFEINETQVPYISSESSNENYTYITRYTVEKKCTQGLNTENLGLKMFFIVAIGFLAIVILVGIILMIVHYIKLNDNYQRVPREIELGSVGNIV